MNVHGPPLALNAWLRYDLVAQTLETLPDVRSILEIGPGQGAVGARLARRYRYVGVEPDPFACAVARARIEPVGGSVVCADASALEGHGRFDLVCAFEVLEHLENDTETLRLWVDRVRPGGWLMLSVPPFRRRFGAHDRAVGHIRRYEPRELEEIMLRCGLVDPRVALYGFPLGFALELARNLLVLVAGADGSPEERTASSGRRFQPSDRLGWATAVFAAPFRLLQRPFHATRLGTGLLAIARRRE